MVRYQVSDVTDGLMLDEKRVHYNRMGFLSVFLSLSDGLSIPLMLFLLPKDNTVQSPHEHGPLVLDFSPLKTMSQTNFGSL